MNSTVELTLSGIVQGVGMRFFVRRTARKFGINGYVKNLYNDNVLVLIQGKQKVLDNFIIYMKKNSPGVIDSIAYNQMETDTIYTKFSLKIF